MEGELADLICESVSFAGQVGVLNTGSEATYQAIRVARAYTSRDHIIVMQGGYNGWHNDVACNLIRRIAAVAGRRELMELFSHPDPKRRVLLGGTYNGHPVPVAAAIATIRVFRANGGAVYTRLERLGQRFEDGFAGMAKTFGARLTLVRQGSAFCIYFMDHAPVDWHDIAANHDFNPDVGMRRAMIERGVLFFPAATKQCSISAAHKEQMIDETLSCLTQALSQVVQTVAV